MNTRKTNDRPHAAHPAADQRFRWDHERIDKLEEAIARGDSWHVIERRFGSKRQNLMHVARMFGIKTRKAGDNKHFIYSPDEIGQIIDCCEKMMTDAEIAALLGRPKGGITTIRNKLGIEKPNKTRVYVWLVSDDRWEYTDSCPIRKMAKILGLKYSYLLRLKYHKDADTIRDLPASSITGLSNVLDIMKAGK